MSFHEAFYTFKNEFLSMGIDEVDATLKAIEKIQDIVARTGVTYQ